MSITVYSKPACAQCYATISALRNAGHEFEVVNVMQDAEALATILGWDYKSVPVVVAGDKRWSGFRPDLISGIAPP